MSEDNITDDNNLPPEEPIIENQPDFQSSDTGGYEEDGFDADETELNRKGSSIGGGSGKTLILGVLILAGTAGILYYLFSDPPPVPKATGATAAAGVSAQIISAPSLPSAAIAPSNIPSLPPAPPPPPPPPAPPPPPPPPAPPAAVRTPAAANGTEAQQKNPPPPTPKAPLAPPEIKAITAPAANPGGDRRSAERMKSNMLLIDGGAKTTNDSAVSDSKAALKKNDPNAQFSSDAIAASEVETVTAGKLGNLNTLIAQGKILNAVLETAINTDLPGLLRGIVSRDVYAEAGKNILIPKGSRLIGTYNTGIITGQKRILVIWTRVIRPDGVDIMIGSPGVDGLGRAGVGGQVDNKYSEAFSAALLTSVITLGVGVASDKAVGTSTTTTTAGSTTNTNSSGADAAKNAASAVGAVGTDMVKKVLDINPTITVDQGTRISVFVNKDLKFPAESAGGMFVE